MKINLLKKRYFIIIFVSIISILYGVFYNYFENLKDKYLKEKTQSIYLEYKVIYNMHKSIADLIFKTDINKSFYPKSLFIFSKYNDRFPSAFLVLYSISSFFILTTRSPKILRIVDLSSSFFN